MKQQTEEAYMRRAIELALRGVGKTNPNPMVGAVIVKNGRIIGEGWHQQIGGLHAERNALATCTEDPQCATLYVTLEPCCHYGKTPPCTEAILEHGIARVVIGSRDPNPLVSGKGVQQLRAAGVAVTEDYLREECDAVNPVFFHYIRDKQPYVALKYAMTADGKTAVSSGESQWITGESARLHVHQLRNYYRGILVGIGTVLADDPLLTCRLPGGRNPVRIVCDSHLRIPLTCQLCQTAELSPVLIACWDPPAAKKRALEELGAEVLIVREQNQQIDLRDLLRQLGQREIDGILAEGGGTIHAALIEADLAQHIYAYVGAQIFGGNGVYTPVGGAGVRTVRDSLKLMNPRIQQFDADVLLEYDVN